MVPDDLDAVDEKPKKPLTHAEQGAADLEKVTEYFEDTELSAGIDEAVKAVTSVNAQKKASALPKIKLRAEDIELLRSEFELSKLNAEKRLKEFNGDVRKALIALSR